MLTIDNILLLSAAGYTKSEINALAMAAEGKEKEKQKAEKPQPADLQTQLASLMAQLGATQSKKESDKSEAQSGDITAQLTRLTEQVAALTEQKKEEPKRNETDIVALLQSMNVNNQRYDLPPQYDVEKQLGAYFGELIGGKKEKEEN